jgi:hypothetical protein
MDSNRSNNIKCDSKFMCSNNILSQNINKMVKKYLKKNENHEEKKEIVKIEEGKDMNILSRVYKKFKE